MSDTPGREDSVAAIDDARVRHVALLSRLALSDAEVAHFSRDLTNILHHINKLDELDVSAVEPTSHALAMANVFRPDAVAGSLGAEAALSNAPDREGPYFKVPQVV